MEIGLFFGSFNPIHIGHLIIAQYFLTNSEINEIWFIVSPHNPLKRKSDLFDPSHRLEMVRLAIEDNEKMVASDIEFSLPAPSYTINTLSVLSINHPKRDFVILMGADSLDTIQEWKNYQKILDNYKIYIYPRKDSFTIKNKFKKYDIQKFNAPIIEISSTLIRDNLRNKNPIKYLVPGSIFEYLTRLKQ